MENTFLSNLQQEGDTAFEEESKDETPAESEILETDTQAESAPETKPEGDTESSPEPEVEETKVEEDAKAFHAFHEHPRWIAREKELEKLRTQVEEYEEFKSRVEPVLSKIEENKSVSKAPEWFTALFGADDNAWSQYQQSSQEERKRIREDIMTELKPVLDVVQQTKKQAELQEWANKQWDTLREDTDVQKDLKSFGITIDKVQGEISNIMSKYKPTDDDGNISLKASYEIWKETRKTPSRPNANVTEKKKVAAISRSKDEGEKRDYKTSEDFKGLSFADLIN